MHARPDVAPSTPRSVIRLAPEEVEIALPGALFGGNPRGFIDHLGLHGRSLGDNRWAVWPNNAKAFVTHHYCSATPIDYRYPTTRSNRGRPKSAVLPPTVRSSHRNGRRDDRRTPGNRLRVGAVTTVRTHHARINGRGRARSRCSHGGGNEVFAGVRSHRGTSHCELVRTPNTVRCLVKDQSIGNECRVESRVCAQTRGFIPYGLSDVLAIPNATPDQSEGRCRFTRVRLARSLGEFLYHQ